MYFCLIYDKKSSYALLSVEIIAFCLTEDVFICQALLKLLQITVTACAFSKLCSL